MEKGTRSQRRKKNKKPREDPQLKNTDPIDTIEKQLSTIATISMPCRNSIEIMFGHFDGDENKTVQSFLTSDANEILQHWTRKTKKQKDQMTSTPTDIHSEESTGPFSSPSNPHHSAKQDPCDLRGLFQILKNEKSVYEEKLLGSWDDPLKRAFYHDQIVAINQQRLELIRSLGSTDGTNDRRSITERVTEIEQMINIKLSPLVDHEPELYDPWSLTSRTRHQQDTFKIKLIHLYQRQSEEKLDSIRCMVADIDVSSESIVAAHIWPASTNGRGLRRFNLDSKCLNDARNGLLLHRLIEKAFDRKQLCFIFDQIHECLKVKVLCPHIRNNEIERGIKFYQINGRNLQLPKGVWPFRRLLNWHAIRAYEYARSESWIDSQETLTDYYHVSDNKLEMPGYM